MNKKLFFIISVGLLVAATAFSLDRKISIESDLSPVIITSTSPAIGIIISTPSSGRQICLDYLVARSTVAYTLAVLNNQTTFYQITKAANEEHQAPFTLLCSSKNVQMQIRGVPANGSIELNYKGFIGY